MTTTDLAECASKAVDFAADSVRHGHYCPVECALVRTAERSDGGLRRLPPCQPPNPRVAPAGPGVSSTVPGMPPRGCRARQLRFRACQPQVP